MVSVDVEQIDARIAAALRGEPVVAPESAPPVEGADLFAQRIHYHGVAGLLAQQEGGLAGWPEGAANIARQEALAAAMWELRHRQLISELLAAFAATGISARLLKGTALAYSLFAVPATRTRGDSDLLIRPADLDRARELLRQCGFERADDGDEAGFALQEPWRHGGGPAVAHYVDLHWQLLNAPALADVLSVEDCFAEPVSLPSLSPHAFGMSHVLMLIHACIHRSLHFTSPYFVDGRVYFGGDRLIWLYDIHLLGQVLTREEWSRFTALAGERGVATVCLEGLLAARRMLGSAFPDEALDRLASAPAVSPAYLRSRQLGRAWADLKAIRGVRAKLDYARARTFPPASFVRDKYPRLARLPLPLLYARRMLDLVRPRPSDGQ